MFLKAKVEPREVFSNTYPKLNPLLVDFILEWLMDLNEGYIHYSQMRLSSYMREMHFFLPIETS